VQRQWCDKLQRGIHAGPVLGLLALYLRAVAYTAHACDGGVLWPSNMLALTYVLLMSEHQQERDCRISLSR